MLSDFEGLVAHLYMEWEDCLMPTLKPGERTYFESICLRTATKSDVKNSLYRLSYFLARKFERGVIVLIDEYEAPNNCAYEHGYFVKVRSLYPFRGLLMLMTRNLSQRVFRARSAAYSVEGDHD
jgi:hypothetical protein